MARSAGIHQMTTACQRPKIVRIDRAAVPREAAQFRAEVMRKDACVS